MRIHPRREIVTQSYDRREDEKSGKCRAFAEAAEGSHPVTFLHPDDHVILQGMVNVNRGERDERRKKAPCDECYEAGNADQRNFLRGRRVALRHCVAVVQHRPHDTDRPKRQRRIAQNGISALQITRRGRQHRQRRLREA